MCPGRRDGLADSEQTWRRLRGRDTAAWSRTDACQPEDGHTPAAHAPCSLASGVYEKHQAEKTFKKYILSIPRSLFHASLTPNLSPSKPALIATPRGEPWLRLQPAP